MPPAANLVSLLCHKSARAISIVVSKLSLEVLSVRKVQHSPTVFHIFKEITYVMDCLPSYLTQYSSI